MGQFISSNDLVFLLAFDNIYFMANPITTVRVGWTAQFLTASSFATKSTYGTRGTQVFGMHSLKLSLYSKSLS